MQKKRRMVRSDQVRKKTYQSVVYNTATKPLTGYPSIFAEYLRDRLELKKGAMLLDAGCGRAEMLNAFDALGYKCAACDLEAPADGMTEAEIQIVDFTKDPFPYEECTFDVVISKSVIEHFYDPDHYIKEIYRVLRSGGVLILLTPDWESQFKVFFEDHTHVHPYLPLGVERLLLLHGFDKVEVEKFSHYPAIWRSRFLRCFATTLRMFLSTPNARRLTRVTGIKLFRWSVELQILSIARKSI